jgi:hypothetical protein
VVDENDITLQSGDVGGMFAMPMITGINAGLHKIIPAAFINENFSVTYGIGEAEIFSAPLIVSVEDAEKEYGNNNPEFGYSIAGFVYNDSEEVVEGLTIRSPANSDSWVGTYPIAASGAEARNYQLIYENGTLTIVKVPLIVTADDKTRLTGEANPEFTITYSGLVGDDTKDSVCIPYTRPANPIVFNEFERTSTYTNVQLNGQSNIYTAEPGESIVLTGSRFTEFTSFPAFCPGCITQLYIGMGNGDGGNTFTQCYDVSGISTWSDNFNIAFNAPMAPGVYYITQRTSWYFFCYQNDQPPIIHDAPFNVIAVVLVGEQNNEITASTTATTESPAGTYPIFLQGCSLFNPNYDVILENGELTVSGILTGSAVNTGKKSGVNIVAKSQNSSAEAATTDKNLLSIPENTIFPNPAQNLIRYRLNEDVKSPSDIQVLDNSGRINQTQTRKIGEKTYETTVSGLSSGLYFLKVKTDSGIKTLKFVKL